MCNKNIKHEKIKLDKRHLGVAEEFAKKRSENSALYRSRGGFKINDIICGALGEMAVHKFLKKHGIKTNRPDFTIHENGRKSYDADLCSSKEKFHVKSQTLESATLYGHSWLMQQRDPILCNPTEDHFIVPTCVNLDLLQVTLYGIIRVRDLLEYDLIGECKVDWFNKTKCAIYLEDLVSGLSVKRRWRLV